MRCLSSIDKLSFYWDLLNDFFSSIFWTFRYAQHYVEQEKLEHRFWSAPSLKEKFGSIFWMISCLLIPEPFFFFKSFLLWYNQWACFEATLSVLLFRQIQRWLIIWSVQTGFVDLVWSETRVGVNVSIFYAE